MNHSEDNFHSSLYEKILTLPVIVKIIERLEKNLSPSLSYHSLLHTLDVLSESLLFGIGEGLTSRELELLAIAAAYHDSGFLISKTEHEIQGAEFAIEEMKADGTYSEAEIELVKQAILDTRVITGVQAFRPVFALLFHREVRSPLSPCLLDADVSNFGRTDFFSRLIDLGNEEGAAFESNNQHAQEILVAHQWITKTALTLRDMQKQINIELLKDKISAT